MKAPTLKIPEFKIPDLPKPVQISVAVIGGSLVLFVLLALTLGVAASSADDDVIKLRAELQTMQRNLNQSKTDYEFVLANQQRFEALMASDKLIPHTRRTAVRRMQALAQESGLSALNFNFQAAGALAPEAVAQQPKSNLYRVYVENIELSLGAPLDQGFYSFIAGAFDSFPGSMVVTDLEMERAPVINAEALNKVSRGEDSGLVVGKIKYSWRTAQQNEQGAPK
jgi:hypothetical protein